MVTKRCSCIIAVVSFVLLCAFVLRANVFPSRPPPPPIDCENVVSKPADHYPDRSPQAVHSAIANIVRGHDLVEIGTQQGDGMNCFAQFARSAVAIEKSEEHCSFLKERSSLLAHPYRVECKGYEEVYVDADYYTWWSEEPFLYNVQALLHLRKGQLAGKIRANATALLLNAHGESEMHRHSGLMQLAAWQVAAPFAERPKKLAKLFPSSGVWHVVAIRLSSIDVDVASKWKDIEWGDEPPSPPPPLESEHILHGRGPAPSKRRAHVFHGRSPAM